MSFSLVIWTPSPTFYLYSGAAWSTVVCSRVIPFSGTLKIYSVAFVISQITLNIVHEYKSGVPGDCSLTCRNVVSKVCRGQFIMSMDPRKCPESLISQLTRQNGRSIWCMLLPWLIVPLVILLCNYHISYTSPTMSDRNRERSLSPGAEAVIQKYVLTSLVLKLVILGQRFWFPAGRTKSAW